MGGSYICDCVLQPQAHRVSNSDKLIHRLQLKNLQSSPPQIESPTRPSNEQPSADENALADLLTGLTVADGSENVANIPPSSAFSAGRRDRISATATIQALRGSIERVKEAHISSPSSVNSPHSEPSSIRIMGQHDKNALNAICTLSGQCSRISDGLNTPDHDCISSARKFVDGALKSVKAISRKHDEVQKAKAELLSSLDKLDFSIRILESALSEDERPIPIDTSRVFTNPTKNLSALAQIMSVVGVVLNVVLGIAQDPCDFIVQSILMIVQMAMSVGTLQSDYNAEQRRVLAELPSSLYSALKNLNVEGNFTEYAACPSCHHLHLAKVTAHDAGYPSLCEAMLPGDNELVPCRAPLLEMNRGRLRPIKPYLVPSFNDYLARLLSDPETERLCDQACDDANERIRNGENLPNVRNVFGAQFVETFVGPTSAKLFVDRGEEAHLGFMWQMDFFRPGLSTKHRANSIAVMTLVPLNLPETIRNKPEYTYAIVVPGPSEPDVDEINSYIRPVMDSFVDGWHRGFSLSRTALRYEGRQARIAVFLSANDLPAARKAAGLAGHSSNLFMCSCCDCPKAKAFTSNWASWNRRDVVIMRKMAEAYRAAKTLGARKRIFRMYGVRWSEFWRLPYWDPTRMLVVDPMHNGLEGLEHYHCRQVLLLDEKLLKQQSTVIPIAYHHDWVDYSANEHLEAFPVQDSSDVGKIHNLLQHPLKGSEALDKSGDLATNQAALRRKLESKPLQPLRFVRYTLGLNETLIKNGREMHIRTKAQIADQLVEWRMEHSITAIPIPPHPVTEETITYIRQVIAQATAPSWVTSIPPTFGHASAGSLKADQWKTLCHVYLPLALITLWGDSDSPPHLLPVLDHTMALFLAVMIACRQSTNAERASAYRDYLKHYVDHLRTHFPHTYRHRNTNIHVAFHIHDFLLLFGPVMSWWCFSLERLIGFLQKLNTNCRVGGELEKIMTKAYVRGANLRAWLSRKECPQVIKEFKILFDAAFLTDKNLNLGGVAPKKRSEEHAYFVFRGVRYSLASAHLGNSLVSYLPPGSGASVAGSIQKITTSGESVLFSIQRQAPLPSTQFDPFQRYHLLGAKSYSTKMLEGPEDVVPPSAIISHVVRYHYSDDRAVILNLSKVGSNSDPKYSLT